jgi:hypothetical protein
MVYSASAAEIGPDSISGFAGLIRKNNWAENARAILMTEITLSSVSLLSQVPSSDIGKYIVTYSDTAFSYLGGNSNSSAAPDFRLQAVTWGIESRP